MVCGSTTHAYHRFNAFRAIECPDDDQVGKPFDIREAGFQFRPDFQPAFRLVLRASPFGVSEVPL
jgi:hypothetical protein